MFIQKENPDYTVQTKSENHAGYFLSTMFPKFN